MAAAVFVFTTITLTEAPTPCPLPAAIPPVIPVYFSVEAAKTKMSPFAFMTLPFPICAPVVLLLTNTWMTPSPATEIPLLFLLEETPPATRTEVTPRSLSALMFTSPDIFPVTFPFASTVPPAFTFSPRAAFTAMLFTIVLMATPALLLPPYATEPVITAAFTLEAAVTFSPSVSTSTTLFPTSASTVSSMTRTVKEPAPVKLLPTVDADPPTASR